MTRLILVGILFCFSLLILFRAPANLLWYVSILITEFCWIFFLLVAVLLFWKFGSSKFNFLTTFLALAALVIYSLPVVQALRLADRLPVEFEAVFGKGKAAMASPFRPLQMLTGISAKKITHQTFIYDSKNNLSLDFYASEMGGRQPCVLVIHGGSWAAGDKDQLPELNSELAKSGYHVASMDYRLAPTHHYPAQLEDVKAALDFLSAQSAMLNIDTASFTLLGRSAGGQIAMSAACVLHDSRINGVINFYGPADMVWGYENPTNPLVLDSRLVMRNYLGGSPQELPQQYINSSATETVTKTSPPVLMLFAENDPLVSPRHGNRLAKKLDEYGVKYFALYLPWATHAFDYTLNGPGGQLSTWAVKRFLAAVNNR